MSEVLDDTELARRIAKIMGQSSAATDALRDFERRLAAGQDATIMCLRGLWIVGPRVVSLSRDGKVSAQDV